MRHGVTRLPSQFPSVSIFAIDNDRNRAEQRVREWFSVRYRSADMGSRMRDLGQRGRVHREARRDRTGWGTASAAEPYV